LDCNNSLSVKAAALMMNLNDLQHTAECKYKKQSSTPESAEDSGMRLRDHTVSTYADYLLALRSSRRDLMLIGIFG
jgi:hypothetical protein